MLKTVDPALLKVVMVEAERTTSFKKIFAVDALLKKAGLRQLPFALVPAYTRGYNELFARPSVVDTRPSEEQARGECRGKCSADERRAAKVLEGFHQLGAPRHLHQRAAESLRRLHCKPSGRDQSHVCTWMKAAAENLAP